MMERRVMTYEHESDTWVVEINGYHYTTFCGETFEIIVGPYRIPSRIELAENWYVIMGGDVSFDLCINKEYPIYI